MDQVLGQKPHPKNVHFKRRDGKPLKWKKSTKDFAIHKDVEKALVRMEEVIMEEMMVEKSNWKMSCDALPSLKLDPRWALVF